MKFSVITICRNNLSGLKLTYKSIYNQTFADYEWLVIDGASDDGTVEYLNNVRNVNIRFISEPDKGLYDAMNKGIRMASGDFMVFMNSGDMFMSQDTLQIVSVEIDKNAKTVMVYGDALDFEPVGKTHYRKARNHNSIARGMFTQHQSMFFARLNNGSQPFYDINYKLSADYQFIIKYLKLEQKGFKIIKLNLPLSRFELGGLNESRRYQALKEDFSIRRKDLHMNNFKNNLLYLAHFLHTNLKRFVPGIMKAFRYNKTPVSGKKQF